MFIDILYEYVYVIRKTSRYVRVGGKRDMLRRYYDAMCVCQKLGKPTYFVTVTCNPYWAEVRVACVQSGQSYMERPNIVALVFALKLAALRADLYQHGFLGQSIAHLDVIEFQKRGLPHAHILLVMPRHTCPTAAIVDTIVSAKLPLRPERAEFVDEGIGDSAFVDALLGYQSLLTIVCNSMVHREHMTGFEPVRVVRPNLRVRVL